LAKRFANCCKIETQQSPARIRHHVCSLSRGCDTLTDLLVSAHVNGAAAGSDPVANSLWRVILRDRDWLLRRTVQIATVNCTTSWSDPAAMMNLCVACGGEFGLRRCCVGSCRSETDQAQRDQYRFCVMHFGFRFCQVNPAISL
jgi:hypothetical protein